MRLVATRPSRGLCNARYISISGTTLVELMIAVTLLTIVGLGFAGAFSNIAKAIQTSKSRTVASNLAQEQMQILKQQSFNQVLVTTATAYVAEFGDDVPYDTGYYPPETIMEGGMNFTRYTYVQVTREDSGTLQYFGAVPDTGMKAILVSVVWTEGTTEKKVQIRNILGDINSTMTTAIFNGKLKIWPTSNGIAGGRVTVAENVGYEDTSNNSGNYSINVFPGNYTLVATADGYFPVSKTVSVAPNGSSAIDFDMVAMGSGTVRGTVWLNDHLVVSQVVASTVNAAGFDQEYVELFNPTTTTWTIGTPGGASVVRLMYERHADAGPTEILMDYNTLTVNPNSYYLFANTSPVVVAGVSRVADAVYKTTNVGYPDIIWDVSNTGGSGVGNADAVGIALVGAPDAMDVIGWTTGSNTPQKYEGHPFVQNIGFEDGEQYVRYSSTSGVTSGIGRAYDSNDNSVDITSVKPIIYPARNTTDSEPVVSGTPAIGAYVTATDGLSQAINALSVGSPPSAQFTLTSVATGTWMVFLTSGIGFLEVSSVTVTTGATSYAPNSLTVPAWPASGYNAAILSQTAVAGYVTGWVKNTSLNPISPAISVSAPGVPPVNANTSNGMYFLALATGVVDVTANPNNQSSQYVSLTSQTVHVELGQVTSDVNFTLSQGGKIKGSATRDGINALTGISFIATDLNNVDNGPVLSGADGSFTLINLATGSYVIQPVLGSGETANPTSASAVVTAGATVNVGTFTISGAFGSIRGNVTASGNLIRSGVLLVCSTSTLSSPPAISSSSISGGALYTTNSYEDGSYELDVRGSTTTTYRVYAYYTTYNVSTPTTTVRSASNITVTAGNTTSGVNFAW